MSLKTINREDLHDVFAALEEAFKTSDIDYYLIGALARDIWYARGEKQFRTTKDVDFAILVGSHSQYEQVRKYLEEHKDYVPSTTNAFVVIAPDGTTIDLLPFGALELDDAITLTGTGLTSIKVNGFMEVFKHGTQEMEIIEGHSFRVATLPSIVLLKLIAYDDRPDQRLKDARDIANILIHYFDLEADLIYENHNDLFAEAQPELELEEIACIVIGREMKKTLGDNKALHQRVLGIIESETGKRAHSAFVRNMTMETGRNIEDMAALLNHILTGLAEQD